MMPLGRFGRCSALQAGEAARILLGLYSKGLAEDPDTYVAGIATILAAYPTDVVQKVCSPFGIASKTKWLPSVYEVKEACEIAMGPYYAQDAKRLHEQEMCRQEIADERRYGPAGPLTEEQMAANRERFDGILKKFKKEQPASEDRPKITGDMTKIEAEANLSRIRPIRDIELSDDLKKLMGLIDRCIDESGAR